ncbi:hypothetical protein [Acinetobacter sp.]|uniref:hypothetical protein n=1 Tax=Acinetobacter sp. TaxID=472 RepID=UPI0038910BC3
MKQRTFSDHTNIWKIVMIAALFVSIGMLLVFAFQQKTPIIEPVPGHKIFMREMKDLNPSLESQNELKQFVNDHDTIIGVNITAASFQHNTRTNVFFFSKIDEINKTSANGPSVIPLFNANAHQNERVVRLINGEFICYLTRDTAFGQLHPVLLTHSPIMCSISIPPGFGDFVGWINIHLSEVPTPIQLQTMRKFTEELSSSIYTRDVLKKSGDGHEGGSN